MIQENPYMKYFLGFDHFSLKPIFDPSLFVYLRKCVGIDSLDKMNQLIIEKALDINNSARNRLAEGTNSKDPDWDPEDQNRGKWQIEPTIADTHIKFPTDLTLMQTG